MSSDLILLTAIFRLIGGGPFLVIALYVAIVNDLSDRETRYVKVCVSMATTADHGKRSINIYKAFVVKLVIDLVAPQAASLLLGHSLWLPTLVCVLLLTACLLDLSIMQETMPEMHASVRHSSFASKRPGLGTALDQYKDMMSCRPLRMGLLIDLLVQFRYNELQLFPPYISVRFEWRIAEVSETETLLDLSLCY